jgi:hypothetical protein
MTFNVNRGYLVAQAIKSADTVLPYLVERNWGLMVAGKGMPNFVCSDNPVSIVSTVPLPSPMSSPGFGMMRTMVLVRLTRRVVLLGMFEPVPPLVPLDKAASVALINTYVVTSASRWVFSPEQDFIWLTPKGKVGHASDLRDLVGRAQANAPQTSK